jgi:hypothetical protein
MARYVGRDPAMQRRQAVSDELRIRAKLLEALRTGGERSRRMVVNIVGGEENFERIVRPMLAAGELYTRRCRGGRIGVKS